MRRRLPLAIAAVLAVLVIASCTIRIGPTSGPAITTTETTAPTVGPTSTAVSPGPSLAPPSTPPGPYTRDQLVQHVLELINKDRADFGQAPVVLGTNLAAQRHADDMFSGYFLSHWGSDGLKPYMRYTLAGGGNYEMENSAYAGWYNKSDNPNSYQELEAKSELDSLEYAMMYNDSASNNGHHDNIIYPWHKKVNIGIAWDRHRLAFVEQFEGEYVQFTQLPTLTQRTLSMSGTLTLGEINSVAVFYDPAPKPMTQDQLLNGPHSYSLGNGQHVAFICPPPPPGSFYRNLPPDAVQASRWKVSVSGANVTTFDIQADLGTALNLYGPGVYTVAIVSTVPGAQGPQALTVTNYSLFVP